MSYLYNFNLSAEEEARAKQIHDELIVIDIVNMGIGGTTIYQDPEFAQASEILPNLEESLTHLMELQSLLLTYNRLGENYVRTFESAQVSAEYVWS